MIDFDNIKEIIKKDDSRKLYLFYRSYKDYLHRLLQNFLTDEPFTKYRNFLSNHPEGRRRVEVYLDCFEAALNGDLDIFLEDQKQIGYIRAMEGYDLYDVYGYTVAFKQALWQSTMEYNKETENIEDQLNSNDIFILHKILDCSYYLLSLSFIQTRDEIINKDRDQLHALQRYAAEAMSIYEEEKVWARASQGVFDLYGLNGSLLIFDDTEEAVHKWQVPKIVGLQISLNDLINVRKEITHSPRPIALDVDNNQVDLNVSIENDDYRLICAPIQDHLSRLVGIIFIHDQGSIFPFSRFDRNLLFQFLYITAAACANCRMVTEIAHKQEDLRSLTARLISVQEEERKKISADIHDIITQALTGIGYKVVYCEELIDKDPGRLKEQLNLLTDNINEALGQSRVIISNLRPRILDDIGIIAAFRKLCKDYKNRYDLEIKFIHPHVIHIDPDKGISLFRILQEALHNIVKHAQATKVDISLSLNGNDWLDLVVKDNGQGFDARKGKRTRRSWGLGLITMDERAKDLGGNFELFSKPSQGCNIYVSVPLKENFNGFTNKSDGGRRPRHSSRRSQIPA